MDRQNFLYSGWDSLFPVRFRLRLLRKFKISGWAGGERQWGKQGSQRRGIPTGRVGFPKPELVDVQNTR